MKKEKKYIIWTLGVFLSWIIISVFWYTCGIKGFCQDEHNNRAQYVEYNDGYVDNEKLNEYTKTIPFKDTDSYYDRKKVIVDQYETKNFEKRTITCMSYINSNIRLGSTKNIKSEVEKLENFLKEYYSEELNVDGFYDQDDMNAVIRFQEEKKLVPDGVVGPKTLRVMNAVYCVKNENK